MRRIAVLIVTLACGQVAPDPPPPSAYVVGYYGFAPSTQLWHSTTSTTTSAPEGAVGTACFTRDGATLLTDTGDIFSADTPSTAAFWTRGQPLAVVVTPGVAAWGIRGDAKRLSWASIHDGTVRTYDVATSSFGPILSSNVSSRALYAADDRTLVFARTSTSGASEIVTMRDDGAGEDVLVTATSPDWVEEPSFSWDGSRVVFVRGAQINVVTRATHVVQTFDVHAPAFDPHLTPDDSAIIFVTPTGNFFSIARFDLATGTTDMLVQNAMVAGESTWPPFHISVAPDAL
jgi:Tol biopolymer transport system component